MIEYWITVIYLTLFFGVFTWYRRLILADQHIEYLHYGVSFFEAMVLGKVIMVGDALRMGRGFKNYPLIVHVLYRTVVFMIFIGVFRVFEYSVIALYHGKSVMSGIESLTSQGRYEMLAGCLVKFLAFLPLFAFKEIDRALGKGKLREILFQRIETDVPAVKA